MTQQEFTQRTLVAVSTKEFWAIHEVYMNSDLDKDDFCKAWAKMNASRVKAAKEAIKVARDAEKQAEIKMAVKAIEIRIDGMPYEMRQHLCGCVLSKQELNTLEAAGINTKDGYETMLFISDGILNYLWGNYSK